MPLPALTLLCARLQAAAYDENYLATGVIDLSPFSDPSGPYERILIGTIWANDPRVGKVRHGFISSGHEGIIWVFDGTLVPKGSFVEWLDDFDAFLCPSPWNPSDRVHRGMLRFYNSLTVEMGGSECPISKLLTNDWPLAKGSIYVGHSLGTFTATCACLEGVGSALYLFAAPKPGDSGFRKTVFNSLSSLGGTIESYSNRDDAVPRVPLTLTFPFKFADFEPVVERLMLEPDSVTPPIPSDWASAHHMGNILRLMEAVP